MHVGLEVTVTQHYKNGSIQYSIESRIVQIIAPCFHAFLDGPGSSVTQNNILSVLQFLFEALSCVL